MTQKLLQHPILSWVQAALSDEYEVAAKTLYSLALEEQELVTRKKSMLSLAKLAYLASNEPEEKLRESVRKIDSELNLIAHQEDVPVHVLKVFGYDLEKLRVLTPSELIEVIFLLSISSITRDGVQY